MEEYRYFVSFVRSFKHWHGHHNAVVVLPSPIRGIEDVEQLQVSLAAGAKAQKVVITGWRRFEVGPDEGGVRG